MFSLDFAKQSQAAPVLEIGALKLRAPQLADYPAWAALRQESRAHLTRWEPDWLDKDVSIEAYRARIRLQERLHRGGAALSLFTCLASSGDLVGGVTLSDIRYHASHSATIGYWIGERYLRRGYGLQSISAVVAYAFETMRLNRVEAACQPGNSASSALLEKAGFREEGYACDFLFINGAWRDHLLFAITARDYCGAPISI
jgi:ribosomal-protein-alanine N-acetyltransferase